MKNVSLEQIHVPHPCSESWDAMSGGYHRRFCEQCNKHVHDLSTMTRESATALLAQGKLCVQFRRDHTGRVLTAEDIRHPRIARVVSAVRHVATRHLPPFLLAGFAIFWTACSRSVTASTGGVPATQAAPTTAPAVETLKGDCQAPIELRGEPGPSTAPAPTLGKMSTIPEQK